MANKTGARLWVKSRSRPQDDDDDDDEHKRVNYHAENVSHVNYH